MIEDARQLEALDALFVSPHPDDVEIFCGGTVALLCELGYRVGIVDLTRGELASNGTPETRREESVAAARALGVERPRVVLDFGDGQIDDRNDEHVQGLLRVVRQTRPRLLVAPATRDRHPDHEATGRLARRVQFFAGIARYAPELPPHRPQRLVHYLGHVWQEPSFLVDVSAQMPARRAAIAAYESQFQRHPDDADTPINDADFLPSLEARLVALGRRAGVAHAEPFVVDEPLLVDDPLATIGAAP